MSLNDFEFGKVLGKGSFASVVLVTRKADKKIYAMKRINIAKMDQSERESALNEIRILASLSHPNIIGYKEAFFDEKSKTLNIVMEFADDGDIDKKIKDNVKKRNLFSEETIWSWIIQILEGLKYLHENKIMHRDIKCANIFLMKNGLLKLGDLNVSKIAKLGIAQTQTGTPYYISPEIWEEKPYDYKCDIWSVGCIIYEMCTLHPPFRGTSLSELYKNIKNGYYIPISNYSNDIKDIISMMLVIDNKKRASAEELLNSHIIKKWIRKIKEDNYNFLGEEIGINFSKNSKANLIKTIKVPKNLGEINRYLPKKRYNPSEEMMKNDNYEIMKETMKREKYNSNNNKMNLRWLDEDLNKINRNNSREKREYDNYNYNNKYKNDNNNYNRQHTPNIGKYNYLNKYDNNMRLIKKENENNYINNNNDNNNYNYNNNNYFYNQRRKSDYNDNRYNNKNLNQYNYRKDNNYRNNYENKNEYYEENRYKNKYIYNYRRNHENNSYEKNKYQENNNYKRYYSNNDNYQNNHYQNNHYQNEEKNLTPNKYRYQNNERNYSNYNNNYFNNRTHNKISNQRNENNYYNNYNYNNNEYKRQYDYEQNNRNNNFNKKKKSNRYKYIFTEEDESSEYSNAKIEKNDNDYYYQNNHRNNNYRNLNFNNDRRDIGPRYNLYDFRYDNNYNNINKQRDNDEIKIIYQKINYNNYCQQNNFDRKRNYHYYRENGYYNYNQAMENYQNRNNNDNNYKYNNKYNYNNDDYGNYY